MVTLWLFILSIFQFTYQLQEISYNKPKLPSCAQWNINGIIFANASIVGDDPLDIFIDRNNTIYVIDEFNDELHIWIDNITDPVTIFLPDKFDPWGVFITTNGDMYIGSENTGEVVRWNLKNEPEGTVVMNVTDACAGLFVDRLNHIYCSLADEHQVVKQSLNLSSTHLITVAGNGTKGRSPNMLDSPRGIFVTNDLALYVADCWNHRIQMFQFNEQNGTTITENIILSSIKLTYPTAVFFDADDYLFIVDNGNHRIIGSRSNGFYCLVGCSNVAGRALTQLDYPYGAAFDIYGNIFVADQGNHRIQKFMLITNTSESSSIIKTIHSSALTLSSRKFNDYFYETIRINVKENGCYKIIINSTKKINYDVYENYLKPIIPMNNHRQEFEIEISMSIENRYILIAAADELVNFSVIVTGHQQVNFQNIKLSFAFKTIHQSELTIDNSIYTRTGCQLVNYYYQAIEIHVSQTGYYLITSNSSIDMYGLIYENKFDIFNSEKNLILEDDNSGSLNQFKILIYLQININYTLIATTSNENSTGRFAILIYGVHDVTLKRIENMESVNHTTYSSILNEQSLKYAREQCKSSRYYYEAIDISVSISGSYIFSSNSPMNTIGFIYENYFDPFYPDENHLIRNDQGCVNNQFKLIYNLDSNKTYILVVTTTDPDTIGSFRIFAFGPDQVKFRLTDNHNLSIYSSILTKDTQKYSRICDRTTYHYETIEINVPINGVYRFDSNNTNILYGYLYEYSFDPWNPERNLLAQSNSSCGRYHFQFITRLRQDRIYILVITTLEPNIRGSFSVFIYGSTLVNLTRIVINHDECVVGDRCNSYIRGIGLTLDDLLRNEIKRNQTIRNQSILIRMSITLIMIMFIAGLINSILSFLTFRNDKLRKVGCGIYLLSSSITSLLTISMLTIKFWFVMLTLMNEIVNVNILRYGCICIESFLKIFVYFDAWLNACVAVERAVNVSKEIQFNRRQSKRIARWIVCLLPLFIVLTILHEPLHRNLLTYTTDKYTSINETLFDSNQTNIYESQDHHLCVTNYSHSMQIYNTAILFFHLTGPFLANLCSALYIIFGTTQRRSTFRSNNSYRNDLFKQFNRHKQLVISPIILLILSLPRLIISLASGCVDVSNNPWLYLCAYFISFTPSILVFVVFVFPSKLYRKTFTELIQSWKRRARQLSTS